MAELVLEISPLKVPVTSAPATRLPQLLSTATSAIPSFSPLPLSFTLVTIELTNKLEATQPELDCGQAVTIGITFVTHIHIHECASDYIDGKKNNQGSESWQLVKTLEGW